MSLTITCPNCDGEMRIVDAEDYGLKWQCPECGYEEVRGDEEDYIEPEPV